MTFNAVVTASLPTTDAEAIRFALDHLEPFEVASFLSEWMAGKDLMPWLEGLRRDAELCTSAA